MRLIKLLIITISALLLFSCSKEDSSNSNSSEVPNNISAIFQTKYPDAKDVEWKMDDDKWEAEFEIDDTKYEAEFSEDGTWEKTEHKVMQTDIPSNIKSTLEEEFADYSVMESEMYESNKGDRFEIKVQKGGNIETVIFDTDGRIIKVEGENENDSETDMDND